MLKLSQQQQRQLVLMNKRAAAGIRLLVAENQDLREKIASLETQARIDGIKEAMDRKGTNNPWGTDTARDEALRKMASGGKLDVVEQALQLSPDLSIAKFGELSDGPASESRSSTASRAALEAWVLGGGN